MGVLCVCGSLCVGVREAVCVFVTEKDMTHLNLYRGISICTEEFELLDLVDSGVGAFSVENGICLGVDVCACMYVLVCVLYFVCWFACVSMSLSRC